MSYTGEYVLRSTKLRSDFKDMDEAISGHEEFVGMLERMRKTYGEVKGLLDEAFESEIEVVDGVVSEDSLKSFCEYINSRISDSGGRAVMYVEDDYVNVSLTGSRFSSIMQEHFLNWEGINTHLDGEILLMLEALDNRASKYLDQNLNKLKG